MFTKKFRALGLAAGLVAWSLVVPRLPSRWHPAPHAVVAAALAALTRAPVGLRQPGSGVAFGLWAAAPVVVGVAAATALPRVRVGMADRDLPGGVAQWLLLGIPVGTVASEEAAFRGALGTVAADAFGPAGGRLVQATAFGLSHIADARATGEPIVPTVLVTGLAGWAFGWLYARSGSLIAPMLAHLAINEAGAVAALAVQYSRARAVSL
ncbi:CPBP family intramembrane glutamic endopeptidase [Mycolicibacterium tusciae]|uniref:Rv0804 family intramembrane glutamic endopeptidase n=1 Tax=Mycolicibacterium tusciae TaxID=75922 RepID=UPI00024A3E96|nr:CPBP family intramembrane glutamic endopeptidase [Mycolicibacterium tusciae]